MILIFFFILSHIFFLFLTLFVILIWVVYKNFNTIKIPNKILNFFVFSFYNSLIIFFYFYFSLNLFYFIFLLFFINHLFFCYLINRYKISILKLVKNFISLLYFGFFLSIFLSILHIYYPFPILLSTVWYCLILNTLNLFHILLRFIFYSVKNFIFSFFVFLFILIFLYLFGFFYIYFDCGIICFDYFYQFSDIIENAAKLSFNLETTEYCYLLADWHASDSIIFDILTLSSDFPLIFIFLYPITVILVSLYFNIKFIKFSLSFIYKIFKYLP